MHSSSELIEEMDRRLAEILPNEKGERFGDHDRMTNELCQWYRGEVIKDDIYARMKQRFYELGIHHRPN